MVWLGEGLKEKGHRWSSNDRWGQILWALNPVLRRSWLPTFRPLLILDNKPLRSMAKLG